MKFILFIATFLLISQCHVMNQPTNQIFNPTLNPFIQIKPVDMSLVDPGFAPRFNPYAEQTTKQDIEILRGQFKKLYDKVSILNEQTTVLKNQVQYISSVEPKSPFSIQMGRKILEWQTGHALASGTGLRQQVYPIKFTTPFKQAPQIVTDLSQLDQWIGSNIRIKVLAQNITKQGFDLVFTTWNTSIVYSAEASWIAVGK